MINYWKFIQGEDLPVVAAAIHAGSRIPPGFRKRYALPASGRLREEDPFTGYFTRITGNRILVRLSRFAADLNRPREKAVYLNPEDSWGLRVWKDLPAGEELGSLLSLYDRFYRELGEYLNAVIERRRRVVMLDIHSYNHRREGPEAPPANPEENPAINVGTGTMGTDTWNRLIKRFIRDLKSCNVGGEPLDVRENVKFSGGHFPRWIHENYRDRVCVLSVELKKIFMDEWTGKQDTAVMKDIRRALEHAIPGIAEEIAGLN